MRCVTPILGFCAYSNTGKTTLIEALLPKLTAHNLRIGLIKHAHHEFDIDQEGKDSYRLRKAGASQLLITSSRRYAYLHETPDDALEFMETLTKFDHNQLDLIIVEGFKTLPFAKIELHRPSQNQPLIYLTDPSVIAIASDEPLENIDPLLLQFDLNHHDQILNFMLNWVAQQKNKEHEINVNDRQYDQEFELSVSQAQQQILSHFEVKLSTEQYELSQALGYILAEEVMAMVNVPQCTNSAMDGYAICFDPQVCYDRNYQLTVVGQVLAGHCYDKKLEQGEAVSIMTGAPMPQGADTVVMKEEACLCINESGQKQVYFTSDQIKLGQNVRQAGEDIALGERLLSKGQLIEPVHLGLLASIGRAKITGIKPLTVAIFSSGDEVQAPNEPQRANCIYDSNRFTLMGLLQKMGCQVLDLGIIEDNQQALEQVLVTAATKADLILSSGGVSVGDADYIKQALGQHGQVNFWRIKMRPGRPLAFGHIQGSIQDNILDSIDKSSSQGMTVPFFGLPGNPVAVMISFLLFVAPAIKKMQGQVNVLPAKQQGFASHMMTSKLGRTDYLRGICTQDKNGYLQVKETGGQGSGILSSMHRSNCLIELLPEQKQVYKGELVNVIRL